MTNHRVEWKDPQPTVDEALAFADLGLPAMEYSNSYGRALRALAAEVRRLRSAVEPGAPPPPDVLAGALQDVVHKDTGPVRAGRSEKVRKLSVMHCDFGCEVVDHLPGCPFHRPRSNI